MRDLQQCGTATCDDALFHSSLCVTDGILNAVLALLELDLSCGASLDNCNTAGELSQALLQLLLVVVGVGVLDLSADLVDAALDSGLLASALDDSGLVLGDDHLASATQQRQVSGLERQADLLGDDLAIGQDSHVLQHCLTTVAEARSLDSDRLEGTADLVDDQGGQSLALDVLSNDQQRLAGLHDLLQQRQQVLDVGNLAGNQEDVRILQNGLLALHVSGEVTGDVALVEAHTLGQLQVETKGVGLFHGNDAFLADLVHSGGNQLTDSRVSSGDTSGSSNLLLGLNVLSGLQELLGNSRDSLLDAALDAHRVGASSNVAQTLGNQSLSQNGSGSSAVTSDVVGLLGNFLDQLGADLLVRILKFDFTCNGDTVVGDQRCAPLALEDYVATLRAQRNLDSVCQGVQTRFETAAGLLVKCNHLSHEV